LLRQALALRSPLRLLSLPLSLRLLLRGVPGSPRLFRLLPLRPLDFFLLFPRRLQPVPPCLLCWPGWRLLGS
jgi:hypothetical protein